MPRIIAGIAVVISLAAAGLGTNSLAKRESSNTSPFDELLRQPQSSWAITFEAGEDAPCAGILSARFNPGARGWPKEFEPSHLQEPSEHPYLEFDGAFRFLLLDRSGIATFTFDSAFTKLNKLSRFNAEVHAGSGKLLLNAPPDTSLIHIGVKTEAAERRISLARPEPVHLIKKNRRFALHLPPQLSGVALDSAKFQNTHSGFHFRELSDAEIPLCRSQVWGEKGAARGTPIDLTRYVRLLTTGTKDFLAQQLTSDKKEEYDKAHQP